MTTNKKSHDDEHLDFNKLEREVQMAVENEERYWRENDAKIRAVEQRVPTYDDFREMVLAAHLKPLEKEDKISSIGAFTQVWNQSAQKVAKPAADKGEGEGNSESTKKAGIKLPTSGQEFVQQWRRHCRSSEERKRYLFSVGAARLVELFKTEISGGLLGEFLECLQSVEDNEAEDTVLLLEAFTKSQRFGLSLAFFSKKEKELCKTLFVKLMSLTSATDSSSSLMEKITELQNAYEVKKT